MLTPKEEKVIQFITRYIAMNGHSPTLEEIGEGIGVRSRGTVHRYVKALESKGHLQRDSQWRGMRLTGEGDRHSHSLPLAGRVAAGRPIEAIPHQDSINFPEMLLGPDRYVLKVQGDSMIEVGIHDGDYVVIQHQESARAGEIIVALVEGEEVTLKRYQPRDGQIELIPENSAMKPMIYPADKVQIQGVIVAKIGFFQ